jgi:hypothetical protein
VTNSPALGLCCSSHDFACEPSVRKARRTRADIPSGVGRDAVASRRAWASECRYPASGAYASHPLLVILADAESFGKS